MMVGHQHDQCSRVPGSVLFLRESGDFTFDEPIAVDDCPLTEIRLVHCAERSQLYLCFNEDRDCSVVHMVDGSPVITEMPSLPPHDLLFFYATLASPDGWTLRTLLLQGTSLGFIAEAKLVYGSDVQVSVLRRGSLAVLKHHGVTRLLAASLHGPTVVLLCEIGTRVSAFSLRLANMAVITNCRTIPLLSAELAHHTNEDALFCVGRGTLYRLAVPTLEVEETALPVQMQVAFCAGSRLSLVGERGVLVGRSLSDSALSSPSTPSMSKTLKLQMLVESSRLSWASSADAFLSLMSDMLDETSNRSFLVAQAAMVHLTTLSETRTLLSDLYRLVEFSGTPDETNKALQCLTGLSCRLALHSRGDQEWTPTEWLKTARTTPDKLCMGCLPLGDLEGAAMMLPLASVSDWDVKSVLDAVPLVLSEPTFRSLPTWVRHAIIPRLQDRQLPGLCSWLFDRALCLHLNYGHSEPALLFLSCVFDGPTLIIGDRLSTLLNAAPVQVAGRPYRGASASRLPQRSVAVASLCAGCAPQASFTFVLGQVPCVNRVKRLHGLLVAELFLSRFGFGGALEKVVGCHGDTDVQLYIERTLLATVEGVPSNSRLEAEMTSSIQSLCEILDVDIDVIACRHAENLIFRLSLANVPNVEVERRAMLMIRLISDAMMRFQVLKKYLSVSFVGLSESSGLTSFLELVRTWGLTSAQKAEFSNLLLRRDMNRILGRYSVVAPGSIVSHRVRVRRLMRYIVYAGTVEDSSGGGVSGWQDLLALLPMLGAFVHSGVPSVGYCLRERLVSTCNLQSIVKLTERRLAAACVPTTVRRGSWVDVVKDSDWLAAIDCTLRPVLDCAFLWASGRAGVAEFLQHCRLVMNAQASPAPDISSQTEVFILVHVALRVLGCMLSAAQPDPVINQETYTAWRQLGQALIQFGLILPVSVVEKATMCLSDPCPVDRRALFESYAQELIGVVITELVELRRFGPTLPRLHRLAHLMRAPPGHVSQALLSEGISRGTDVHQYLHLLSANTVPNADQCLEYLVMVSDMLLQFEKSLTHHTKACHLLGAMVAALDSVCDCLEHVPTVHLGRTVKLAADMAAAVQLLFLSEDLDMFSHLTQRLPMCLLARSFAEGEPDSGDAGPSLSWIKSVLFEQSYKDVAALLPSKKIFLSAVRVTRLKNLIRFGDANILSLEPGRCADIVDDTLRSDLKSQFAMLSANDHHTFSCAMVLRYPLLFAESRLKVAKAFFRRNLQAAVVDPVIVGGLAPLLGRNEVYGSIMKSLAATNDKGAAPLAGFSQLGVYLSILYKDRNVIEKMRGWLKLTHWGIVLTSFGIPFDHTKFFESACNEYRSDLLPLLFLKSRFDLSLAFSFAQDTGISVSDVLMQCVSLQLQLRPLCPRLISDVTPLLWSFSPAVRIASLWDMALPSISPYDYPKLKFALRWLPKQFEPGQVATAVLGVLWDHVRVTPPSAAETQWATARPYSQVGKGRQLEANAACVNKLPALLFWSGDRELIWSVLGPELTEVSATYLHRLTVTGRVSCLEIELQLFWNLVWRFQTTYLSLLSLPISELLPGDLQYHARQFQTATYLLINAQCGVGDTEPLSTPQMLDRSEAACCELLRERLVALGALCPETAVAAGYLMAQVVCRGSSLSVLGLNVGSSLLQHTENFDTKAADTARVSLTYGIPPYLPREASRLQSFSQPKTRVLRDDVCADLRSHKIEALLRVFGLQCMLPLALAEPTLAALAVCYHAPPICLFCTPFLLSKPEHRLVAKTLTPTTLTRVLDGVGTLGGVEDVKKMKETLLRYVMEGDSPVEVYRSRALRGSVRKRDDMERIFSDISEQMEVKLVQPVFNGKSLTPGVLTWHASDGLAFNCMRILRAAMLAKGLPKGLSKLLVGAFREGSQPKHKTQSFSTVFCAAPTEDISVIYRNDVEDLKQIWRHYVYVQELQRRGMPHDFQKFFSTNKAALVRALWRQLMVDKASSKGQAWVLEIVGTMILDFGMRDWEQAIRVLEQTSDCLRQYLITLQLLPASGESGCRWQCPQPSEMCSLLAVTVDLVTHTPQFAGPLSPSSVKQMLVHVVAIIMLSIQAAVGPGNHSVRPVLVGVPSLVAACLCLGESDVWNEVFVGMLGLFQCVGDMEATQPTGLRDIFDAEASALCLDVADLTSDILLAREILLLAGVLRRSVDLSSLLARWNVEGARGLSLKVMLEMEIGDLTETSLLTLAESESLFRHPLWWASLPTRRDLKTAITRRVLALENDTCLSLRFCCYFDDSGKGHLLTLFLTAAGLTGEALRAHLAGNEECLTADQQRALKETQHALLSLMDDPVCRPVVRSLWSAMKPPLV